MKMVQCLRVHFISDTQKRGLNLTGEGDLNGIQTEAFGFMPLNIIDLESGHRIREKAKKPSLYLLYERFRLEGNGPPRHCRGEGLLEGNNEYFAA